MINRRFLTGFHYLISNIRKTMYVLCIICGTDITWKQWSKQTWNMNTCIAHIAYHDDVIKWKHFSHTGQLCGKIHRSPMNSPHKGQWRGAMMFSLICARLDGWVNNGEAGDLRRHRVIYDVIVMSTCNYSCGFRAIMRAAFEAGIFCHFIMYHRHSRLSVWQTEIPADSLITSLVWFPSGL